ncbi:NIL domain-containing protein, partial [Enterococcus faecium]|uniref:NIL domain-containing protein n=1 Tax=Enterococcus faecium TaxID=1352 RepID=UPI003CC5CB79
YIGNQTNEPLNAHLYSKYQETANILYGNVELLQETPLGSLIVSLAGETKQRKKALDYLIISGVKINILQKNDLDSRIK